MTILRLKYRIILKINIHKTATFGRSIIKYSSFHQADDLGLFFLLTLIIYHIIKFPPPVF